MERGWSIENIASEIIMEMKEDNADIGADDYVLCIAYRSAYSRVPEDVALVSAPQVKRKVLESV